MFYPGLLLPNDMHFNVLVSADVLLAWDSLPMKSNCFLKDYLSFPSETMGYVFSAILKLNKLEYLPPAHKTSPFEAALVWSKSWWLLPQPTHSFDLIAVAILFVLFCFFATCSCSTQTGYRLH